MTVTPKSLRERWTSQVLKCDSLCDRDIQLDDKHTLWRCNRFDGAPYFYPVYRYQDYYSYSMLALIALKGTLVIDSAVASYAARPEFQCLNPEATIDKEIERIGAAHGSNYAIVNPHDYAQRITHALKQDVSDTEQRHPGKVNIVLCGGRDSLNLLLLPWTNHIIAASAEPNYQLVRKFVTDNDLDIEVKPLADPPGATFDDEILACCSRVDLRHWRWSQGLKKLAHDYSDSVIFWKGQVGDLYMSETWKTYMQPIRKPNQLARKSYKKLSPFLPSKVNARMGRWLQTSVIEATWNRAASLQGSHVGFIREITGALTLSAYHGPAISEVWKSVDLGRAAIYDVRPLVGKQLLGRDVIYPSRNPAPAPSVERSGLHRPNNLIRLSKEAGIKVVV